MTKADIIQKFQKRSGFLRKDCAEMVEAVFAVMKKALEAGEDIKVSGFGKFSIREKKSRRGRNPQTGETLTIDGRRVLTFRASALLRAAVNQEGSSVKPYSVLREKMSPEARARAEAKTVKLMSGLHLRITTGMQDFVSGLGCTGYVGPAKTLDEMQEAINDEFARK